MMPDQKRPDTRSDARPNILLIMSDQHSPHILGCAGNSPVRTPHLDRLAREGVFFQHAYCSHPLCVPSRMGFLTSRHSKDIGIWDNESFLPSDIPTFAHALGLAGYETVLCGRMHIVGPDQHHGFSKRIASDLSTEYGYHRSDLLGPHGEIHRGAAGLVPPALTYSGPGRTTYQAFDDDVTRTCVDYLSTRESTQPLCLVVGYVLPHCPYVCPRELFDDYITQVAVPELPKGYLERLHPAVQDDRRVREMDLPTMEETRRALAAYYGMVTYLDTRVGTVLDALRASALADNTVVIYTSDHGEMAGEHGLWMKRSFYEASVGVPLIVSGANVRRGATVDANVSLLDIGPTLVDFARGDPLPNVAGRSLAGFLQGNGEAPDWPDTVFAENYFNGAFRRMIRKGAWKLNLYQGYADPQLFNLDEDPREFRDLGQDPDFLSVADALMASMLVDWSPELNAQRYARARAPREIVRAWANAQGIEGPYHWTAPADCVVFPET